MYSSIIKKTCKDGCGKYPTLGYEGYNMDCRPDLKEKKIKEQQQRQKQRNVIKKTTSKLRNLSYTSDEQRKAGKDKQTKSQLLKEADRLFSLFVRNRDADKNGNIQCVGCGKVYNIDQVDNGGNKVVQNLHFIDRGIYNLRFSEENCHAGCSYCNLDMSLNKNGFAYRRYLEFMTTTYGEEAIAEMTIEHRKINKLEIAQLKNIIEHYQPQVK